MCTLSALEVSLRLTVQSVGADERGLDPNLDV